MTERIKKTSFADQLKEARNKSMSLFGDIAHRLETTREWNGVEFINDSKSTDLDSTYYSLELMSKPVVWIVGSTELENDYAIFDKLVKFKVKTVICFGKDETRIKYSFAHLVDTYAHKSTLEEAVSLASELSSEGDAVLFSPACPSYELYSDFRERGNEFKELVDEL